MPTRKKNGRLERREFLKKVAAGGALAGGVQELAGEEPRGATRQAAAIEKPASQLPSLTKQEQGVVGTRIIFPRTFSSGPGQAP